MKKIQVAPEENTIYLYTSPDNSRAAACGRVGDELFATQVPRSTSESWMHQLDGLIEIVGNSLRVVRELGYSPEDNRFDPHTFKPATELDFPLVEKEVSDEVFNDIVGPTT